LDGSTRQTEKQVILNQKSGLSIYELTVLHFHVKGKSEVAYSTEHTKWLDGKEKGETVGFPRTRASENYRHFQLFIYLFAYLCRNNTSTYDSPIATNREHFLHTF
jgi:hypothetical protein